MKKALFLLLFVCAVSTGQAHQGSGGGGNGKPAQGGHGGKVVGTDSNIAICTGREGGNGKHEGVGGAGNGTKKASLAAKKQQ